MLGKAYSFQWEPTRTLPGRLVDFEAGNRGLKVAWICKPMGAQGAEFRQLKLRTKDFLDVCV
jgi:hypothetical protein